jgi:prephenate dehydratase
MKKIATLGPAGSFTAEVCASLFDMQSYKTVFTDAYEGLQGLKKGLYDIAVFPWENNIGGPVSDTMRALYATSQVTLVQMPVAAIEQHLISHGSYDEIETIVSHPQAVAQCQNNIRKLENKLGKKFSVVKVSSTAQGVKEASNDKTKAAIGSFRAAERYGVRVVQTDFHDKTRNQTRFCVFRKGGIEFKDNVCYATMYLLEFESLTKGWASFAGMCAALQIDIRYMPLLPVYTECSPTRYAFFVEVKGHPRKEPLAALHRALVNGRLGGMSRRARCVGSYAVLQKVLRL